MRPILIAAAVIPAIWLLVKVYREDHVEREPLGMILSLVFLGIFSTGFAALAEQLGSLLLTLRFFQAHPKFSSVFFFFAVVGLSEEGFKYLLLRYRTWNSYHFNCRFDGVVYAVSVSLGFALWENIRYVYSYGFQTALVRAVTAVPGHACFGVFMGVWYGLAKQYEKSGRLNESKRARRYALLIPTLLHGTYDFIATFDHSAFSLIFVSFIAVMFFLSYRLVRRTARTDRYF